MYRQIARPVPSGEGHRPPARCRPARDLQRFRPPGHGGQGRYLARRRPPSLRSSWPVWTSSCDGCRTVCWRPRPHRRRAGRLGVDPGQAVGERAELGDAAVGLRDPVRDQRQHPRPHRRADPSLADVQELTDLLQSQAQELGRGDEGQTLHRVIAADPVPGRCAVRGQETGVLVEAQRRGRNAGALGQLRDAVGRHAAEGKPSIRLEGQAPVRPALPRVGGGGSQSAGSSSRRARTRFSISSRIARTASTPCPAGSCAYAWRQSRSRSARPVSVTVERGRLVADEPITANRGRDVQSAPRVLAGARAVARGHSAGVRLLNLGVVPMARADPGQTLYEPNPGDSYEGAIRMPHSGSADGHGAGDLRERRRRQRRPTARGGAECVKNAAKPVSEMVAGEEGALRRLFVLFHHPDRIWRIGETKRVPDN